MGEANAGNDIFPLRINQEIAFDFRLAGGGVARHGHAGGGVVSHVAEDHRLDVDRRAQVVGNAGSITIINRSFAIPGLKHRLRRQAKLLIGVGGEFFTREGLHDLLKLCRHRLPILGQQLRVGIDAAFDAAIRDHGFEYFVGHVEDDGAKHLHQAAEEVVDEAGVSGALDHAGNDIRIQADIQHRVHHARHGKLGAGAARNQQRVFRITEPLAGCFFHGSQRVQFLLPHAGRETAPLQIRIASRRCHRKTGGHGHANARHVP